MRNISFAFTTQQILDRTKTVTRRTGWRFLKVGDELQGVRKAMGLRKGEKVEKLRRVRVTGVRVEPLQCIFKEPGGLAKEGFPDLSPCQFVERYFADVPLGAPITRIEFEYLD